MVISQSWQFLVIGGLVSGLLAGLLGIGGGTILVPILIFLGCTYEQSVATSSLAIVITSSSGSWQNWRMGYLKFKPVIYLGISGLIMAFYSAQLVSNIPKYLLELSFGFLLLFNIYLSNLRKKLAKEKDQLTQVKLNPIISKIMTGGLAGFLAGLFGIGGGVILVPLQMLLLQEKIKMAIQTSLGVIVITSLSATLGHAQAGNVIYVAGIILGLGGLIGVQISSRYLPKLSEKLVRNLFSSLLIILSIYFFYKAWLSYTAISY